MTAYQRTVQYKTEQPLKRYIDLDGLVQEGIETMSNDAMLQFIHDKTSDDAPVLVTAAFFLRYPDPALCSQRSEEAHQTDLDLFKEKVLSGWLSVIKTFTLHFPNLLPNDHYRYYGSWRASSELFADGTAEERLAITIPICSSNAPNVLDKLLRIATSPKQFQLAMAARLAISLNGKTAQGKQKIVRYSIQGEMFCKEASIVPPKHYLQRLHDETLLRFFMHPTVASIIANACSGYLVTCDESLEGTTPGKRCNIDAIPITINSPEEVMQLASTRHFHAFYPRYKIDGYLGRMVIDLDVQAGMVQAIKKSTAWRACCGIANAIVSVTRKIGLPSPCLHFSGNRGIHIIWNLDDDALVLDAGSVDLPPYLRAIQAADRRLGSLKSTAFWTNDLHFVAKKLLQALVVKAAFTELSKDAILTPQQRACLSIPSDIYTVTLISEDPASFFKIITDTMPTCYRWFCPHLKSGLVTIPIGTKEGDIRDEYRDLETVIKAATIDSVIEALNAGSDLESKPNTLDRNHVEALATALAPEIYLVTRRGERNACSLSIAQHQRSFTEYTEAVEKK